MAMFAKVDRAWRVLATGMGFALFMGGGFILTITAFPIARLWPGSPAAKGRRIRALIQKTFRLFLFYMAISGIMRRPKIEGLKNLAAAGPCVVIANHPTLIDVVILVSLIPDCNC